MLLLLLLLMMTMRTKVMPTQLSCPHYVELQLGRLGREERACGAPGNLSRTERSIQPFAKERMECAINAGKGGEQHIFRCCKMSAAFQ